MAERRPRAKPVPPPPPTAADPLEAAGNRLLVAAMVMQSLVQARAAGLGSGPYLSAGGIELVSQSLALGDELIRQHHATLAGHRVEEPGR